MKKILFLFAIFLFTPILYGMPVNAECSSSTNTGVPCWDPDTGDWLCYSSETCISGYCYETSYAAPGTSCNDGRSCTTGETCDGSGNCGGGTVSCYSPPGVCYSSSGSCDVNGNCAYPYASSGTSCGTSTCPADYCSGAYYYDYQPSCTRYCDGFGGCTDCCTPAVANCGITLSATCISSTTLRTYSSGTCGASGCNYPYTDTTCTYGCSGGSCNPPPAAVCGNGIVESGEYCEDAQTYTSTTQSCGSGNCLGTQSYVYNCISSTCQWNAGAWTACSSQGNVCSTGSCILSSGTCGTGSQSVTRCDSSGGCTSSSSQSCTVGCSSGYTCSGGTCVSTGDTTPPTSSITSPAAGSTQSSNFVVSVSDSDTGGSGLASCDYYVYDSTAGYTVSAGTTRTCNSGITITVGASGNCRTNGANTCTVGVSSRDNAGNQMSPYNTRTFSITGDTTPPTVTITSPASGGSVSSPFTLSATTNEVATCKYSTSDISYDSMTSTTTVSGTSHSWSVSESSTGSKTYYVKCKDSMGYTGSASVSFTVSSITPYCDMSTTYPTELVTLPNTCQIQISHRAYDNSDISDGKYRSGIGDIGPSGQVISRDITFDDSTRLYNDVGEPVYKDSDLCDMDIYFLNNWNTPANNRLFVSSAMLAKDAGNSLSFGFNLGAQGSCRIISSSGSCYRNVGGTLVLETAGCDAPANSGQIDSILISDSLGIGGEGWFNYIIGECSTNSDCTFDSNRPTCDTTTNMCIANIGTPTLISPSNGATTSLTPILTVDTVTNANRYYFYVGDTLGNVIDSFCSLSTQDPILSGTLSSGTTYIWSAKACTDSSCNTCGSYAPSWNFTTLGTPTLISPSNGATNVAMPSTLDWTDVSGASYYKFYARTSSQTESDPTYSFCSLASTGVALGLTGGTTYYWSAKACTDSSCNTCGSYAPEWNFVTTSPECDPSLNNLDGSNSVCINLYPSAKIYCSSADSKCHECLNNMNADETSPQCLSYSPQKPPYCLTGVLSSDPKWLTCAECIVDSSCPARNNIKGKCKSPSGTGDVPYDYTCINPSCTINSECVDNACCVRTTAGGPAGPDTGSCVSKGVYSANPMWLCY